MNKDTELLDIGCNDGKFLKELNGFGINNVRGIEPATDDFYMDLKI